MAPYLRKFHSYTTPSEATAELLDTARYMRDGKHGSKVPAPVSLPDVLGLGGGGGDICAAGWQTNADPIDGRKLGAFTSPLTIDSKSGKRGYAAAYYSSKVEARPSLKLPAETMVERILLEHENEETLVTGVQIQTPSGICHIRANKECIFVQKAHDISMVINNSGVGENLQDHGLATINFEVADGQVSGDIMRDPNVVQAAGKIYEETRSRPLAGMLLSMAYLPLVNGSGAVPREEIGSLSSK
ncbi:Glucose-methanol-choline oxidoreductase [Penicillium argentinense]|uniref:Glucose-methanol-choline oxidoreductase n=1 Tax=Penicillium argentinense TaxID=1131581 RepID=A0A9W9FD74_9EURO|nr:Glucose-methanol-choline oxidoreductase [Penicillium argentinense]KAJ5098022.1 Glucose-methanol-choline oxidoreductase [Penicillium argentinense]